MIESEIQCLVKKQHEFFKSGVTINVDYRIKQLKKLYETIKLNEKEICMALQQDLGKSEFESYMCEVGLVLSEISYMIKHTKKLAAKKTVHTPLAQFYSHSYKQSVPYGNVLILSPWNYPFLLTLDPLADAIAAGNTVIIKPSAYSPNMGKVLKKIISECFPEEYVALVEGGREENQELLNQKFDMIFFTGSQNVGKEVLKHAANFLTPVVLELGGKSPCIIDESADLKMTAKRIAFGKFLNLGQTCVAPDYILIEKSVKDEFLNELKYQLKKQYGENPFENKNYGKIINEKHFERLIKLIDNQKVVYGGEISKKTNQIAPTVMDNVTYDDLVMQDEIFGPILPVLSFENFDDALQNLKDKPKPLALYIFSKNKEHIERVNNELSYGGGCINDVVIHLATSEMGFGGVGESGMGSYHGKEGFYAFSHTKSIVDKKLWIDLPMRYQPYTNKLYERLLRIFLK